MRAIVATTLLASCVSLTFAATGRIADVTVYRDRAEIVRELKIDLPAGPSEIVIDKIPIGADPDSFRVNGRGTPTQLGAVEIVNKADMPEKTPEFREAETHVRNLERAVSEQNSDAAVDGDLRKFLNDLRATTSKRESEQLGEGRPHPEAIGAFYEMLDTKLRALGRAKLDRADRIRELNEELEVARAHLATLAPREQIRSRVATVEVEAARAGTLVLRLTYVVRGAAWTPAYRATLDATSGDVDLVIEAVVRQSTGEEWTDVALQVSSSSPATGVEPPFLAPWILQPYFALAREADVAAEAPAVPGRFYQNTLRLAPGLADEEAGVDSVRAPTALINSAYNVTFGVTGKSTVAADGRAHRVTLRNEVLPGKITHRIVPGLNAAAFLTAVTTVPKEYPLLPGQVRVFVDGAFLGKFNQPEKGPGVELTIPFGPDNRLEVVRVPVPKSLGRQGLGNKQRVAEFEYVTKLHNLQTRPVTVVLEERLPVSEDQRIVVQLDKTTTEGFKDSPRRPGVKLWTFDIEAGKKRDIVFAYSVRYPKDMRLPGIE